MNIFARAGEWAASHLLGTMGPVIANVVAPNLEKEARALMLADLAKWKASATAGGHSMMLVLIAFLQSVLNISDADLTAAIPPAPPTPPAP